jgi:GntR family transcriptional repressor for pyruvate dehydrogenase complex
MARDSTKAGARVAQEIVRTIYEDELKPGDHYLSEADAIARHGVSRATFREALRFLEFQGVIRVRAGPGGGAIVEKPDWPHLSSTFALLLQFADASLADVMAARTALEPTMIALAARHATSAQIAEINRLIDEAEAGIADVAGFGVSYRAFWAALARATGNAVTAMLWPALRAIVDSGGFVPNERYRRTLITRIRKITATVERGDADAARLLLEALDREFSERLVRNYPRRFTQTVAWSDLLR